MSGNLEKTYESFLTRCIGGARKEQEVLHEVNEVYQYLAVLTNKGIELGLPVGWASEGAEGLMESYREGTALAEQEGDVYAFLSPLVKRVRHYEGVLNVRFEELQRQYEKELVDAPKALKEAEKAVEEAKTKKKEAEENKDAADGCGCLLLVAFILCLLTGVLAPVAILIFIFMRKKKRQKLELEETVKNLDGALVAATAMVKQRKKEAEKAKEALAIAKKTKKALEAEAEKAKEAVRAALLTLLRDAVNGLGLGTVAGETKVLELPGGVPMEMVWCPPGTFTMGSPADEEGRGDDETQHKVTLTNGLWLAKMPVTQTQWKSVMGNNPSHHKGDDLPVVKVSWDDCQEFCKNAGLSLPTEAQWEYACRAGSTAAYAGSGKLEEMGWYTGNSDGEPHPVGQKQPNAWGLCDMLGNVWEWCADWFGDYPSGSVTDPKGASSGSYRVKRGGSWFSDAASCRSAYRRHYNPSDRDDDLGFRPASILSE